MKKVISNCFIAYEGFHLENKLREKIGKREYRKIGKDLHFNHDTKSLKGLCQKRESIVCGRIIYSYLE